MDEFDDDRVLLILAKDPFPPSSPMFDQMI